MCDPNQGSLCPKSYEAHGNILKYVYTVTVFQKQTIRSMTSRWPFTPLLLRSQVNLNPRIIVSKCMKYIKVCGSVAILKKSNVRSITPNNPLGDPQPNFFWGHMCDTTQGSQCSHFISFHVYLTNRLISQNTIEKYKLRKQHNQTPKCRDVRMTHIVWLTVQT